MKKQIRNKHVLVLGSGFNSKIHKDKILKFIQDNKVVTFGCNHITNILIPDYHFHGSKKRWAKYGQFVSKKSILVISIHLPEKMIRKYWKGPIKKFKIRDRIWRFGSDNSNSKEFKRCQVYYKGGKMFGCFRDVGSCAIFWAYIQGASKISIVGFDGYTMFPEKQLKKKKVSQHCYGEGFTDGTSYLYSRKKDWDKYKTLKLLYKYGKKRWGFGFEIITPTVYEEFYNPSILKIKKDPNFQKWEEPTKKEYYNLYFTCMKDKDKNIKNFIY